MILVISDDFSGAAELAGIAMEMGLGVEIQTELQPDSTAEVIVLDTNTRSKDQEKAVAIMDRIVKLTTNYDFDLIYKKVDSILRGHVFSELSTLLTYNPGHSILLVSANPSMGRTITNGKYLVNGQPLHKTVFADDPEFPVQTSDVLSLVSSSKSGRVKKLDKSSDMKLQDGTIYVPDARIKDDIDYWAGKIAQDIIPAGAADFWQSILHANGYASRRKSEPGFNIGSGNSLFVCGSSLSKAPFIQQKLARFGPEIVEITSESLYTNDSKAVTDKIVGRAIEQFDQTTSVILSIGGPENGDNIPEDMLPNIFADITSSLNSKINLSEIVVEGGTTASEVVRSLGAARFKPVNQFGRGIIRMQIAERPSTHLTVKPGSYEWPEAIWSHS